MAGSTYFLVWISWSTVSISTGSAKGTVWPHLSRERYRTLGVVGKPVVADVAYFRTRTARSRCRPIVAARFTPSSVSPPGPRRAARLPCARCRTMSFYRKWAAISDLLRQAERRLPALGANESEPCQDSTVEEFNEFLDHNELELTWDALADVGESRRAERAFWLMLVDAASIKGLGWNAARGGNLLIVGPERTSRLQGASSPLRNDGVVVVAW